MYMHISVFFANPRVAVPLLEGEKTIRLKKVLRLECHERGEVLCLVYMASAA